MWGKKKIVENDFINICVQAFIGNTHLTPIIDFSLADLDWEYLIEKSLRQGIIPILHYVLSRKETKAIVPEEAWKKLEETYYSIASANILFKEEFGRAMSSLDEAGIEVIILKGMVLGLVVYSDLSLRPMNDVDVLVHKEDCRRVREKLLQMGYEDQTSGPEDFLKKLAKNVTMDIDVHTDLLNITRVKTRGKTHKLNIEDFWKRAISIEKDRREWRILSPEDNLLDLCLHLVLHHGFSKLIWAIDIACLIKHYEGVLDWDRFLEECEESGSSRIVYYALLYVKNILGLTIPDNILPGLKPKGWIEFESMIFKWFLRHNFGDKARYLLTLLLLEGLTDKINFLQEVIFPTPGVLRRIYSIPESKGMLPYYIHHFKRVINSCLLFIKR